MDLSYCRVSTTAQDLTRRIDAMRAAGVAEGHIYVGKRMRREFFRARPAEVRDILARVDASIVTWSTTLRLVVDA